MSDQTVTDVKGRKIVLRTLDPSDMLDLLEAAGSASSNAGWVRYASVISSVSSIDEIPIPIALNKAAIKNTAKMLGNDGFAAVGAYLFGDGVEAVTDVEQVAKN